MWALSDKEIDAYYKGVESKLSKKYLGTFPKDVIPSKLAKRKHGAMIINMNNSNQGGSHWIAILLNKDNTIYFDSFGVVPSNEVVAFMKQRGKPIVEFSNGKRRIRKKQLPMYYMDRQLQDLSSSSCGWFCIHFIDECILKGRNILDVLGQDFSYDVKENERLLAGYFAEKGK